MFWYRLLPELVSNSDIFVTTWGFRFRGGKHHAGEWRGGEAGRIMARLLPVPAMEAGDIFLPWTSTWKREGRLLTGGLLDIVAR